VSNLHHPTHVYDHAGTYIVSLTVVAPGGCADMVNSITVDVAEVAIAEFGSTPDFPVQMSFPNSLVEFQDRSIHASEWFWDFGDGITSAEIHPAHTYNEAGQYFVTLTIHTADGCMGEVTHGPYIIVNPDLFIPNVFSPNGDGVNDAFRVDYTGDQPFTCKVFDRWGVTIWETLNKTHGWDGKNPQGEDVVDGVYYYVAKVGDREFVGEVTLVR
jgi:gliding motility-associated-like protein